MVPQSYSQPTSHDTFQCVTIRYEYGELMAQGLGISHFCSCIYNQSDAKLDGVTSYNTVRYGMPFSRQRGIFYPPALLISVPVHDTLVKKRIVSHVMDAEHHPP